MTQIRFTIISSFLCVIFLINSCKVTKPLTDNTPPTITQWTLTDQATLDVQKFAGSGSTANVTVGKKYLLTCYANDPQGLVSLSLSADGNYDCTTLVNGSLFTKTGVYTLWYPSEGVTSKPDQNGKVDATLLYGKEFVIQAKYPCDHKFIPFTGVAKNFSNKTAKGNIKLVVK